MKIFNTILLTLLTLFTSTTQAGWFGSDDTEIIKALEERAHNFSKEDAEMFPVEVTPVDFNNDGQTDWYTKTSYDCGSQGCIYNLWVKTGEKSYCKVGKWGSDISKLSYDGPLTCNSDEFLDVASQSPKIDWSGIKMESSWEEQFGIHVDYLTITNTGDSDIQIDSVVVNRSKCTVKRGPTEQEWAKIQLGNTKGIDLHDLKTVLTWGTPYKLSYRCPNGMELLEVTLTSGTEAVSWNFE